MSKSALYTQIEATLLFVASLWAVFLLDRILPIDLNSFGVTPRSSQGLVGIIAMPFLHADLKHLFSNTVPLLVLLALLIGSRARPWQVVIQIIVFGGLLLWLFGRYATHLGASGLIFGLIVFLLVSGLREGRVIPLLVGILVAVLYGGTLLAGVVPQLRSNVSWDGHLCGAVAGGVIGRWTRVRSMDDPNKPDQPFQ